MTLGDSLELAMGFQIHKEIAHILRRDAKKLFLPGFDELNELANDPEIVLESIGRTPPFILQVVPVCLDALFLLFGAQ